MQHLKESMTLPNAVLTEDHVSAIKRAIYEGETLEALANKYRICYQQVSHIKCGRCWSDIEWPDGRTGEISPQRRLELVRMRMQQRSKQRRGKAHSNSRKRKGNRK